MKHILTLLALFSICFQTACGTTVTAANVPARLPLSSAELPEFPTNSNADLTGPNLAPGIYKTPAWFSIPFTFETRESFGGIGEELPNGELFGLTLGGTIAKEVVFLTVDPEISKDFFTDVERVLGTLKFD